jgi:hypothetical protein
MFDVVDAIEIVIELCDYVSDLAELVTDESFPGPTSQGPLRIFPFYGGRFSDPLKSGSDPTGNPEDRT